jgi:carboxyl-terminal processing protease
MHRTLNFSCCSLQQRVSASAPSSNPLITRNYGSRSLQLLPLSMVKKKSKKDEEEEKFDPVKAKIDEALESLKGNWEAALEKLPPTVSDFITFILTKLAAWRMLFVAFTAGAVLTFGAILIPVHGSTVASLTQPVTLFETILTDLEQAYVDPIDTNKLFETGVSAMLRSLDPYTEFEGAQEAVELNESISGRYGGVGLVIAGKPRSQTFQKKSDLGGNDAAAAAAKKGLPKAVNSNGDDLSSSTNSNLIRVGEDEDAFAARLEDQREYDKAERHGIRVVSAFEGYAFDYGMRVGDKLLFIDDKPINSDATVEDVRNNLRGEPGTLVSLSFTRDGIEGVQTVTMPRTVVRLRDVKLATLLGKPEDGIGYIQLTGFASETGREMRQAILALQRASEDASGGEHSLQGLVLDMRGNPGGLLTSAVDVVSLLVPKGSDIVSAKGRGFPGILYRSRTDPILDQKTKLAVLVSPTTASAAEIVSGAVQDLDVGIIVGSDRTYGKGLVQNVEVLPFNTALKFTVAKYYTPSGRCIQRIDYKEGGGLKAEDGSFQAVEKVDGDRKTFYTKSGRVIKDGGGVEVDFKVDAPKASALEVTLLRSGVLDEFAADWSKNHELTNNFKVDEDTYKSFQAYVNERQNSGDLKLEALYSGPLNDLKRALKKSGYKGSEKEVANLQARIVQEVKNDFEKYRSDIKEDISQSILARYVPESMLIERSVGSDKQVQAAMELIASGNKFERLLAQGSTLEQKDPAATLNMASNAADSDKLVGFKASIKW